MKAQLVTAAPVVAALGEGPHWDMRGQKLYWVDIEGRAVHRLDPKTNQYDAAKMPDMVGFAVLDEAGKLVAGLRDGFYRVDFATVATEVLSRPGFAHADNRFNDGKCDRRGRLWAGTMNNLDPQQPTGALYRLDERGLHEHATGIHISNGTGWSPDNKTMYYTDTVRRIIWQYDYEIETGAATNRRTFAEFTGPGRPDGLTVDAQGRVLTALWPGWCVEIYAPDGKLEDKIELPVPQVSSCAFGGADMKTLYITTAATGLSPQQLADAPFSGRLFSIDLDVGGLPETPFRG